MRPILYEDLPLSERIRLRKEAVEIRQHLKAIGFARQLREGHEMRKAGWAPPPPPSPRNVNQAINWVNAVPDPEGIADLQHHAATERITPPLEAWEQFVSDCEENTGNIWPESVYNKKKKERDKLRQQSLEIAERLDKLFPESRQDKRQKLFKISLFGRVISELPQYRQITLIPEVAAQKRSRHLKYLEWLGTPKVKGGNGSWLRMWVVNDGRRCRVDEIPDRLSRLNARIRRLQAKEWFNKNFEIVFRSTEFGSLFDETGQAKTDSEGHQTYHVHSHLIVRVKNTVNRSRWLRILALAADHFGGPTRFEEAGGIEKLREACKYLVKPADILRLPDPELAALSKTVFKRHLVQPLGRLREVLGDHKSRRLVLQRPCPANKFKWRIVRNHNSHARKSEAEELADIARRLWQSNHEKDTEDAQNTIVAVLPAGPHFGPVHEPCILVRNLTNYESVINNIRIKELRERCAPSFAAGLIASGRFPAIGLDNTTVNAHPPKRPPRPQLMALCQ